jgi:hemerythrin-like domain-containing protein
MKATEVLRKEHEAILKMLDATERTAMRVGSGDPVRPELLGELVDFFRVFADQCHHGKEEDHLFPALIRKGLPSRGGPIHVMLVEHGEGREYIRLMASANADLSRGVPDASRQWADAALNYVSLLRAHIAKENDILFVMAERLLSDGEQSELSARFEEIETQRIGAGTHERIHARMGALLAELAGEPAAV